MDADDDVVISLFDVQGKKEVSVVIDRESKRYTSISVRKNRV